MKKRTKLILLGILCLSTALTGAWRQRRVQTPTGLFSWGPTWNNERRDQLFSTMKKLGVTELYQHADDTALSDPVIKSFLARCSRKQISVYYTTGRPEWGLNPEMTEIKEQIDLLDAYNRSAAHNERFSGILFDIEPFMADEWDKESDDSFQLFTEIMIDAYRYAHERDISVILCLPYWFDSVNKDLLELLVDQACDKAAFMNYDRPDEIKNLQTEMRYCKRYEKPLICIFEFQPPGVYDLTDNETYYSLGISSALKSFETLREYYGYDVTMFAYHPYSVLPEIMERTENRS